MQSLGSLLEFRWLPSLLSLDLSGIPLGPSGIAALSKGLAGGTLWSAGSLHSSGTQAATLPLKVLKLSNTEAKAKGVETLAEALKAKQLVSLEVLDLGSNRIYPQGLMHLAAAIGAEAVPILRVLILKDNRLTDIELSFEEIEQSMFDEEEEEEEVERDFSALGELLSGRGLSNSEELDLSEKELRWLTRCPNCGCGAFPEVANSRPGEHWYCFI